MSILFNIFHLKMHFSLKDGFWSMKYGSKTKKLLQKKSYLHIQNITVFIFDDSPITKLTKKLGEFNVTNNSTSNRSVKSCWKMGGTKLNFQQVGGTNWWFLYWKRQLSAESGWTIVHPVHWVLTPLHTKVISRFL